MLAQLFASLECCSIYIYIFVCVRDTGQVTYQALINAASKLLGENVHGPS